MSDCIFCKIAAGEIPSNKVYEDDKMIAFKDLEPAAPVHVLLVPKTHADNVMKAEPALVGYMLGKVAGQTVQHLHIHLIGGKAMGWPPFPKES